MRYSFPKESVSFWCPMTAPVTVDIRVSADSSEVAAAALVVIQSYNAIGMRLVSQKGPYRSRNESQSRVYLSFQKSPDNV